MAADDHDLDELAGAILDGVPLDWNAVTSASSESQRAVLDELRAVTAIRSLHRRGFPASLAAREAATLSGWGHLTIIEPIGRGTFGTVYRAHDPQLARDVALKLLPAGRSADEALTEGRLLARVHHPNVVTVFGADRIGGHVGLWMELVTALTLEQLLVRDGPFAPTQAITMGRQLCGALTAVHAAGLVHRDVKAHNVMMTDQGRVVLMDFGAGRLTATDETAIAGTPLYLAPEIFDRHAATPQSDIYSVGVLLFHVLTGRYPVEGRTLREVRQRHQSGTGPLDVRRVRPDVPRRLAAVVARALAASPDQRYSSAAMLAAALDEAEAPAVSRRVVLVAGAGVVAALLATPRGRRALSPLMPASLRSPQGWLDSTQDATVRRLSLPDSLLWGAGLSHDGHTFAYTTGPGHVAVFDMRTAETTTLVQGAKGESAEFAISSSDGQQIAYQWWTARQRFEIRVIDRRGYSPRVLVQDDDLDYPLPVEWSRDGASILMVGRTRQGLGRIWRVDTASGALSVVREFGDDGPIGLSLSPDGLFIVYDHPSTPGSETRWLHIVGADGLDDHRLLADADGDERLALWTPDGRHVFFISDRSGTPGGWIVPVESGRAVGEPKLVLRNLAGVTPLGLVEAGRFYYRLRTGAFEVFELPLDPTGAAAAGRPRRVPSKARGAVRGPVYSPDGRQLAYTVMRETSDGGRPTLTVLDLATGRERVVSPAFAFQAGPSWSPEGRRLLVRGRARSGRHGIFVIDAESGGLLHEVVLFSESQVDQYGPIAWSSGPDAVLYGHAARGLVRHSLIDGSEDLLVSHAQVGVRRIHRVQFNPESEQFAVTGAARDGKGSVLVVSSGAGVQEIERRVPPEMIVVQGWSWDGAFIYFTAPDTSAPPPHDLWRVPAAGGAAERLPIQIPGGTQLNGLSFSRTHPSVAYTAGHPEIELWIRDRFLTE